MFLGHTEMKLEISTRKEFVKFTSMCKLNNTFLSNQVVKKKSQGKLGNALR